MLIVKCVDKVRQCGRAIKFYKLQDRNGNIRTVEADQLKALMYNKQIECINLKLTSNGRIIDTKTSKEHEDKYNTDRRCAKEVGERLAVKARVIGKGFEFNNAKYTVENGVICLEEILISEGTFEIPEFVGGIHIERDKRGYGFECNATRNCVRLKMINKSKITSMKGLFFGARKLKELDLSEFDTSMVTDMSYMFTDCGDEYNKMESLDLSRLDTSKVTDMNHMFTFCNIKNINLSGLDTSKVTDMSSMFAECFGVNNICFNGIDTSNVINMEEMFEECTGIKTLDISSFNFAKVKNVKNLFDDLIACNKIVLPKGMSQTVLKRMIGKNEYVKR